MKVTRSGLIAITCILNEIIESDNGTNEEISLAINFLKTFRLSDDKLKQIVDEACKMSFEDAAAVVKNMDEASKQELSNIISEIMLADGAVSDEEAVKFMALIADCDVPMPDTKAWVDWCRSTDNDQIDDLSGEDSEICFFVIRAGGAHYGGKCRTIINKKYEYGISDSTAAKMLLGCKEHILYDCGESELLDMLTREMGFEGYGRFHGYVCKKPYDSSDNHAASEIFGRKISGHCLIRFKSNEGQYLEMNKAQCARLYGLIKENLTCKLLHRTEDQCHFHTSGPPVMRLSRQKSPSERIKEWLRHDTPESHGFEVYIDDYDFLCEDMAEDHDIANSLDTLNFRYYAEDEVRINSVEDLLIHVIDSNNEAVELLTELAVYYRSKGNMGYALYWAQKAVILSEIYFKLDDAPDHAIQLYFEACTELGNCYFSESESNSLPDLPKAAYYYKEGCESLLAARAYIGMEMYNEAETEFDKIRAIGAGYSVSVANAWQGQMYFIRNMITEAIHYWQLSIEGISGWGEYFMGRWLWGENREQEAIRLWEQGLEKRCYECKIELYHVIMNNEKHEIKDEWHKIVSSEADNQLYKTGYQYLYWNLKCDSIFNDESDEVRDYKAQSYLDLGLRNFSPYCAELMSIRCSRDGWKESAKHYERVMKAWGCDGNGYF